jgi:CRISPR/Cas system CSM-associated protein Csm2 small subunit
MIKVIDTSKNSPNNEFQHCMESKLIEVMNDKMQMIQFVSIVNLIQMKLMKVIDKMKNISNQEFQQCEESQVIEVMKMKKQMIQFLLIVNLI